jgi:oligopeptide transport system substrate-binding protein
VTPRRRPALALLVLLGLASLLAGCGADPYAGLPDENTLRVVLINEMKGFDPTQCDEEISNVCVYNFYDQLYEYHNLKRPFELVPCLAASMPEVSEDELTVTVRLKKGVRYHDDPCFVATGGKGREMVASDAVFCFKRMMDARVHSPGTWLIEGCIVGLDDFMAASEKARGREDPGVYRPEDGYPEVEGLAAPDPHTFVIRLTKPYRELTWVLAMAYFSIYPPEAVQHYGKAFREHPVSTGPYLLESYSRAQRMVLVRNPAYREDLYPADGSPGDEEKGRLALAGRRLPLNDRVVATVIKEDTPMWLYFTAGHLDRAGIPKDNFDTAVDPVTEQLKGLLAEHQVRLERDPRIEVIYDCFNFDDPVIGAKAGAKGRALRRAMSLGMDEEWARINLYNRRVSRVEGPVLREFPEHDPTFKNPWKRRPDESMEQARERARKILASAGMGGGKGVPEIAVDVTDSATDEQFFVSFQTDMKAIGITVRAYKASWQEQIRRQRESKFQMVGLAWGADYPEAQNFLQLFYGPNRSPGSNSSNYANPEYDALYEKAVALRPGPERTELYRKLERIVVDDAVWIFRYRREQWSLLQPWLQGFRYNDISLKSYKYSAVDSAKRRAMTAGWNPVRWLPSVIAAGVVALLVGLTLLAARRQVKGW